MSIHLESAAPVAPCRAGPRQGVLLVGIGALLQTMLITLVAPSLPEMQQHFAMVLGAETAQALVPIAVTSPALSLALLSPFVGGFIDRYGRRLPMLISLIVFAVIGLAPIWIEDLSTLLIARLVLGAVTAVVITSSITLVGDLFSEAECETYFAINAGFAAVAAILCMAVGGLLGGFGWRVPYWVYAVAILFFLAAWILIDEPARQRATAEVASARFPFGPVIAMCLVVIAGSAAFFVSLIFIGDLAAAVGVTSSTQAGLLGAGFSLSVPLGAASFQGLRKARLSVPMLVTAGFVFVGIGLLLIPLIGTLPGLVVGALIQQYGAGYLLAGMMIWMMSLLPEAHRGKGTGAYFTSFMVAQPICGIAFPLLRETFGGRPLPAVGVFGAVALVTALVLMAVCARAGLLRRNTVSS